MSLAAIKREMQIGRKLRLVEANGRPCDLAREVVKVQANAVAMSGMPFSPSQPPLTAERPSWLYWPKASQITDIPGGFRIQEEGVSLTYLWDNA